MNFWNNYSDDGDSDGGSGEENRETVTAAQRGPAGMQFQVTPNFAELTGSGQSI